MLTVVAFTPWKIVVKRTSAKSLRISYISENGIAEGVETFRLGHGMVYASGASGGGRHTEKRGFSFVNCGAV